MNEYGAMVEILTWESGSAQRKLVSMTLGLPQILTWTELGLKVGLHGERLVTA